MSKYAALGDYLRRQRQTEVPMTFREIERITHTKLPASARYRAWWSNNPWNSVLTKVWLEAGFKSEQVDLASGRLIFRRIIEAEPAANANRRGPHPLFGALKGQAQIAPNTDLTAPADPSWGNEN